MCSGESLIYLISGFCKCGKWGQEGRHDLLKVHMTCGRSQNKTQLFSSGEVLLILFLTPAFFRIKENDNEV